MRVSFWGHGHVAFQGTASEEMVHRSPCLGPNRGILTREPEFPTNLDNSLCRTPVCNTNCNDNRNRKKQQHRRVPKSHSRVQLLGKLCVEDFSTRHPNLLSVS